MKIVVEGQPQESPLVLRLEARTFGASLYGAKKGIANAPILDIIESPDGAILVLETLHHITAFDLGIKTRNGKIFSGEEHVNTKSLTLAEQEGILRILRDFAEYYPAVVPLEDYSTKLRRLQRKASAFLAEIERK